jgi:hypothetical protein
MKGIATRSGFFSIASREFCAVISWTPYPPAQPRTAKQENDPAPVLFPKALTKISRKGTLFRLLPDLLLTTE